MKPISRILHRLIQLSSIVLLFLITPIIIPISINMVVMAITLMYDKRRGSLYFDFIGFNLAYILMFFTAILFPDFELLPHTPQFIYSVLFFITSLSLVLKRPVTGGQTFKSSYSPPRAVDYINTGVWATAFLSAMFCSFYFFPKSEYLIYSLYALLSGIIIKIMIWIIWKQPRNVTTFAK